jgi:tRNA A37 threonylcarbamoyladenosine synthetase subunit TsaC/SUA5/YrdC
MAKKVKLIKSRSTEYTMIFTVGGRDSSVKVKADSTKSAKDHVKRFWPTAKNIRIFSKTTQYYRHK